jgi:GT2 family glycosyltransferase
MAKILIAVPHAGGIEPDTLISIYNMDVPPGIETELKSFYGYLIDDSRNKIVKHAVDNGFDGVLFVDSDMTLPRNTLARLVSENKDIVSGLYIKKRSNDEKVIELFLKNENFNVDKKIIRNVVPGDFGDSKTLEVDACGFGCVLVRTEVFLRIGYPYFKYHFNDDPLLNTSEDIDFCIKAKYRGYRIYAATDILLGHIGKKEYKL